MYFYYQYHLTIILATQKKERLPQVIQIILVCSLSPAPSTHEPHPSGHRTILCLPKSLSLIHLLVRSAARLFFVRWWLAFVLSWTGCALDGEMAAADVVVMFETYNGEGLFIDEVEVL